jgi:hypothetical protein
VFDDIQTSLDAEHTTGLLPCLEQFTRKSSVKGLALPASKISIFLGQKMNKLTHHRFITPQCPGDIRIDSIAVEYVQTALLFAYLVMQRNL